VLLRQGHHREALENLEKALEILEAIQQSERSGEAVERAAAAWLRHEALCALGEQDQSLDMSAVLDEINWKAAPVDSPLRFRLVSLLLTASTS
jgi:tetratricopeptide (TPR) repeat protein